MDMKTLITARFLVEPGPSLLWRVTPYSLPILQSHEIPINTQGEFAPPDEWRTARNLANYDDFIAANKESFANYMSRLVERAPNTLERCTRHVTKAEYSLLLSFAGQDVYDFFVHDHRFGPPPRGRKYRSNIRGEWVEKVGGLKINRPDNALLALRRSIEYYTDLGADVTELRAEYARREQALAEGRDWREGQVGLVMGGCVVRFDRPKGKPGRRPSTDKPWTREIPRKGVREPTETDTDSDNNPKLSGGS